MNSKNTYFSKLILYVGLLLIIAIVIALHFIGVSKPIEELAIRGLSPVVKFLSLPAKKTSETIDFLTSVRNVRKENMELKIKLSEIEAGLTELEEIKYENQILREELGFNERRDLNLEPAFIIGFDATNYSQSIIINKGKEEGIELNDPVIASQGILVGQVTEVYDRTAKVLLVIDSRSSIPAIVQDDRASGVVKGQHGIGLVMETISQDEEIKIGERVITSGIEGEFPKGLLIGEISNIKKVSNELFQEAELKTLINYSELEMVFAIKDI